MKRYTAQIWVNRHIYITDFVTVVRDHIGHNILSDSDLCSRKSRRPARNGLTE